MTDTEKVKQSLAGHTIALCKGGDIVTSDKRGIASMLGFIAENRNLAGYSVADLIVGKAAAMLFVKAGIAAVHAKTLSVAGRDFLQSHGVSVTYDVLTERIFNRDKTDVCPMEKTVENLSDCDTAYVALCKGGDIVTSDKRGIASMLGFIAENRNLAGYSVADLIVGKAAAMLFVKEGIAAVHAKTLSVAGRDFLQSHGVSVTYGVLTERIFNRDKTDVCPMEKTVENLSDCDTAYVALSEKAEELRRLREANANR